MSFQWRTLRWILTALAIVVFLPYLHAQDEDFDQARVRITALWLHSSPTVTLEAAGHDGFIDFNRDFGFNDYSTFLGRFDWRFTRKNHLFVVGAPFIQSQQVVLNRTITFRGQTYNVGAVVKGELNAIMISPGYQYDITRRKRGHLGIAVQINLFNSTGKISAAAQVTGTGISQAAASSSASLLAPIPVAGPEGRLYLTNSPRLYVEGYVYGMYLFGYGNFISANGDLGFSLTKNLSIVGGYTMGSRLKVNDTSQRVGLQLTQTGPTAGIQLSF